MKSAWVWTGMLLIAALAMPAAANVILTVKATAGQYSATESFDVPCVAGQADWALGTPRDITVGGVQLGQIKELAFQSDSEPFVNLHFSVEAFALDTTFEINSAVVTFGALLDADAYASAGVTLTGDEDGATLTGLFDGASYQARYDAGILYANLVRGFSVDADQTLTHSDRSPAAGYNTISTISSIESQFKFTLSALDQASGTSRFYVTPEPATLALLGLCGLALIRRRKA